MRFTPGQQPHTEPEPTDEELLVVLRRDGEEGLRLIARKHASRIRRRLLRSFGPLVHEDDADSAVTEALLVVHRNRAAQEIRKLGPYLGRIARNECVQILKERLDAPVSLDLALADPMAPEQGDPSGFAVFLAEKVEGLPRLERELFRIDASRDESAERIAEELGSTRDAIYALRYRRKQRFRDWLDEWERSREGELG